MSFNQAEEPVSLRGSSDGQGLAGVRLRRAHDHGWYQFLRARPEITEVNFWRPGGTSFRALAPGAPFFFKLKRPHNAIGGFGLFARADRLPVWRAWDVFGQANGTRDEHELLLRLDRLGWARTTRVSAATG